MSASVVVTMDYETLLGGLKAAHLDTGTMISPGLARLLACQAGVIPVVLGGGSQVLDVGRKRRFHSEVQRVALGVRDGGCTTIGCDRAASWCEAHHEVAWSRGGGTSVEGGRLLCSRHHHLAHHPSYDTTHHPGRKISFNRRE
ncbi:HNH endonuclease signature motif containing protein [Nocardioides psychrotolerans]|uniref:HNH endonuclease signature motif containing protein n=1 Tax=Nocardioides psychrotolerans TaxID=1005945 RepID=UPI00210AA3C4|nr:HNH endonuclease signature motif containing protein [Nocardioides psychrotolerans]